ncbi:hypothetical protein IAT38_002036 [Cryptococcus sp. DSM 104549]
MPPRVQPGSPSGSSGLNRRPTIDRSHSHSAATPSASSPQNPTFGRVLTSNPEEDRGLTMRERERADREREKEWQDEKGNSMGKAGGVGVGVTRPKRRLSSQSLPTLLHPFFPSSASASSSNHRAMSSNSVNSPPASPLGGPSHGTYQTLQQQSFHNHAQQHGHAYGTTHGHGVGQSSASSYQAYSRTNPPKLDDKVGMVGYATAMAAAGRDKEGPPKLFGIELKWISLVTLALQNAFLTIIMHYSRISALPNHSYSAATAVLLNELLKGTISVFIALKRIDNEMTNSPPPPVYSEKADSKNSSRRPSSILPTLFHPSRLRALYTAVISPDCYKLSVPAILYVIQNNLQYVAASNLDVATFQVTYQMKILTTAFFSVLLLRKRLSRTKWASLVLLAVGVGIVQIQTSSAPAASSHAAHSAGHVVAAHGEHQLRSDIPAPPDDAILAPARVMHPLRGFTAVTMACMTSGLAGVYFEFILKSSSGSAPPPDLWVRNTQLSLFSLVPALVPIVVNPSGPEGMGYFGRVASCFDNFNGWAVGTVLTQTLGGLITALVIRYSDNIMKGFATSLSIIISFLASVALFSYPITVSFVLGASIVLFATYTYNSPAPSTPSTRTAVAVAPGSPIPTTAPILGEPERPSRTSSMINLLGLGGSNQGSRKPSLTDIKGSAGGSQLGLSAAGPAGYFGGGSAPHSASASAPGTPSLHAVGPGAGVGAGADHSGRSSPGVQAGGPGTGFGRGGERVRPILSLDIDRKSG